ncbi:hypothetical protein pf16_180 [Pseudomonas phage pf16]|uniref:Uncharacterized protein n=1 Tax=Pseudomonas phage pf16 TaxID=1815630 RepID=A0A1S5R461_9CAUD|nr:hypothetical protein FDG98_gp118 [Pseudomonas phage pf16]AND75103.1 hypothetical protein pf16_180 [Pseudomonas phage pf16]
MNAKEMREKLNEFKQCVGIEAWLADIILEMFRESSGKTIAYPPYKLDNRGWERRDFVHRMRELGYHVEFKTKQFEPEMCYISLPDEEN